MIMYHLGSFFTRHYGTASTAEMPYMMLFNIGNILARVALRERDHLKKGLAQCVL